MARINFFLLFVFISFSTTAQVLETHRITDWSKAGNTEEIAQPSLQINIFDHGADNTGINSCNSAYNSAIQSLNGAAGVIYFPEGEYFFNAAISIPDSVVLKGESSATKLRFNLGGSGNLIVMNGSIINVQHELSEAAIKGTFELHLNDASEFDEGDVVKIGCFDEDLMYSSWAYGTLGQVLIITEKDGNTLRFEDPLNHHYPLSRNPFIKKINPRTEAGISCLTIEREDSTSGQTSNIYIGNATNCFVRNVESINCNFSHIEVNSSAHVAVEGCYIHHAFAYGGGGQGYGVVFQSTSSFNLAQNNIFNHLRHSMLLQSGANGNVYAYNYSYDPYWEDGFLPSNSAADAVLHGNYVYLNLFEGNTVQNIVVDASHGSNGPYNTFFRNRAELYGFFSDSGTPTDSMNVVGNEITNSGFPYGLFMVNGVGYCSHGNNVNGTTNPTNTSDLLANSLFLDPTAIPDFLNGESLPLIGYPLAMEEKTVPAEIRFQNEDYVGCSSSIVTNSVLATRQVESMPFVYGNTLNLPEHFLPARINLFNANGQLVFTTNAASQQLTLPSSMSNGIYIAQCISGEDTRNIRFLISQ
ncbi:MAG: T9SS type A sorting domain-containing protein [Flavobacteriales bacterium]|nr:T9SS type A sorting domain-containing protein [Flavobacteriales bacterium]